MAQGLRLPAEWEPHAATWVAWPHNRNSWPGNFEAARMQFAHMARTIAEYEPVHILAGTDGEMWRRLRRGRHQAGDQRDEHDESPCPHAADCIRASSRAGEPG